jgi:hypothetical protein
MGADKEGNHKLSPFLQRLYRGNIALIIVLCRNPFSVRTANYAFAYKVYFRHRYHLKGQEQQGENDHTKANFAGWIDTNLLKIGTKESNAKQCNLALILADLMKY